MSDVFKGFFVFWLMVIIGCDKKGPPVVVSDLEKADVSENAKSTKDEDFVQYVASTILLYATEEMDQGFLAAQSKILRADKLYFSIFVPAENRKIHEGNRYYSVQLEQHEIRKVEKIPVLPEKRDFHFSILSAVESGSNFDNWEFPVRIFTASDPLSPITFEFDDGRIINVKQEHWIR